MSSHNTEPQPEESKSENPNITLVNITTLDREKGFIVLGGHPCKIKGIHKIRSGFKSTKTIVVGSNIFTGKEHSQNFLSYAMVEVPIIKRIEYSLIGIEDNFASLMDKEGNLREDLKLPSSKEKGDLTEKIINAFEANQTVIVTVLEALEQEMIVDLKEDY